MINNNRSIAFKELVINYTRGRDGLLGSLIDFTELQSSPLLDRSLTTDIFRLTQRWFIFLIVIVFYVHIKNHKHTFCLNHHNSLKLSN